MPVPPARVRRAPSHETRVLLLALAGGAPAVAIALAALARVSWDPSLRAFAGLCVFGAWLGCALAVRERVTRPLQTLSNLIAAMREGDTSIRARGAGLDSALGLALWEVNALTEQMRGRRYEALDALSLVRQVMESIDVAMFGFDSQGRLRLVNRDGEQLLALPEERALGRDAASLGLGQTLEGGTPRLLDLRLPGRAGRWELRRGTYRHGGRPHQLVVLSDLGRSLREEERQAWQRLIRVLSHEINNSLAPIQSIAGSLRVRARRARPNEGPDADVHDGLRVIETRAQSLGRFMHAYAQLARLPEPEPEDVDIAQAVRRAVALETRMAVGVREGPAVILRADPDQLDQLLINLVRNAADAALETRGSAWIGWNSGPQGLELRVEDEGPGLADTSNLFVPFFTTKPEGSGIGLALSRQIAEGHGGTLLLENRAGATGCVATLRLPSSSGPPAD